MKKQPRTRKHYMNGLRELVCRWICGNRLFNSDMSREIDRLTIALEECQHRTDGGGR